jgi:hypothetical protein
VPRLVHQSEGRDRTFVLLKLAYIVQKCVTVHEACDEARDQEYFLAEQKLNLEVSVTLLFVIIFLFLF